RLDAVEQPHVDEAHRLGGRERDAILGRERRRSSQIVSACPATLESHQGSDASRVVAAEDVVLAAVEAPQVLERQIDAAAAAVLRDVAQYVGELKGDAEVDRVVARARVAMAEDLDAEEADGRGDAVAVAVQLVEVVVAPAGEVGLDAGDEV